VVEDSQGQVLGTFETNSEAWRWLEKHETRPSWVKSKRQHRRAVQRHWR
jgi:hypothetical protein